MIKQKWMSLLLLVCLLAIPILTVSAQEPVTVTFWVPFTGPDGEVIEAMVNDFNETVGAEEGVMIDLLIVPWDDYYTKLTVAMAAEQPPHLAIAHSHRVPGFVEEDVLIEFPATALEEANIVAEDYVEEFWNAGEINGTRYALAFDSFPRTLYYNTAMFEAAGLDPEAPPTTWDELIEAAALMTDKENDVWGAWLPMEGSWLRRNFYSIYWQYNPDLLTEELTGVAEGFEEAATASLQTMYDLIYEHEVAVPTPVDGFAMFAQGKVGILFSQITHVLSVSQVEGLEWNAVGFPLVGDELASFALGHNFVLPAGEQQDEEHLAAVNTFIKWFNENSIDWVAGGKVPATYDVMENEEYLTSDAFIAQRATAAQLDAVKLPPIIAQQPQVDQIVTENLELAMGQQITIEEAVARMAEGINSLLQ